MIRAQADGQEARRNRRYGRAEPRVGPSIGADLLVLEPRILFDAAGVAVAAQVVDHAESQAIQDTTAVIPESDQTVHSGDFSTTVGEEQGPAAVTMEPLVSEPAEARREIVFIDPGVEDYQILLAAIDPRAEVVLFNSDRDGMEQIAEVLAGRTDIDAVHIISHGTQAELTLGTSHLTLESMNGAYADELAVIGQSLSEKADLLIYGCDFGQGEQGAEAATRLAELTGADVAASTDATEATILGPDASGPVEVTTVRRELVILDPAVQNSVALRDLLLTQQEAGRDLELFVLDSERGGVEQIAEILARYQDLDAVHVLSHGTAQGLQLGSTWLDAQTINDYSEVIRAWQGAFGSDADLLLYGCDLAGSDAGRSLVDTLGQWTGTDVAASTDLTGYALFGGDWDLEYRTGSIETEDAANLETQHDWVGLMSVAVDSTSTGSGSSVNSVTVSHTTTSAGDRLMLVGVSMDATGGPTVTSVTYGGQNLTLVGTQSGGANPVRVEIWRLVNPPSGTANAVVNLSGNADGISVGVTTFTGVNQTTPLGAFASAIGTSASPSVDVTSASGELVYDVVAGKDATSLTQGTGQTELWELANSGGDQRGAASTEAGAATVTMSWSKTTSATAEWAIGAVSIKAASNTAPTISNLAGDSLAYSEGDGAVVIEQGGNATVSDVDSANFDTGTLTVSFTAGSDSAEDVLAIRNQGTGAGQIGVSGATVTYQGVTIGTFIGGSSGANLVITFNASATPTAVTALVKNITYQDTDTNAPTTGARTVRYVLTDGDGGTSANSDTTVTVSGVNDAPLLDNTKSPILTAINEDAGIPSGTVGTLVSSLVDFASPTGQVDNVTDVDAGAFLGIAVTAADTTNGTWWYSTNGGTNWNALGSVSDASARLLAADANTRLYFQPNANYNGTLSSAITFRAWDQTTGTNGGTATLATTLLDQFSAQSYGNNDGTASWASSWVETDSQGGGPSGGRIEINGDALRIKADTINDLIYREANLSGAISATLSFNYDNQLGSGDTVVIQVSNNGGASYSTLSGGTFSDVANSGLGTATFDITSSIAANTRIQFLVTGVGIKNRLIVDDVQIAYTTSATVGGTTAFSTATDSASLTINPINDPPVITNLNGDSLAYNEGAGAVVLEQGGDATVSDGDSADFDTGTLTVSFTTGSDSAEDVLAIRNQGTGAGQIGVSGATVTYQGVTIGTFTGGSSGSNLVVTLNSSATPTAVTALVKNVTFEDTDMATPTTGARTVRYVLTDGDGGTSANHDTTVTVSGVNDAPDIVDATVALDENSANATAVTNVSDSFTTTDFDRDGEAITYSLTAGNTGGAFAIDAATGAITVATSAALDFETTPSFTLTVQASDGSLTDTAAITVNLNNLNDNAPDIVDATVALDENSANATAVTNVSDSFTTTDFDRDGQAITYSLTAGNTGGAFAIDAATGAITVATSAALDFETTPSFTLTVQASDGSLTDTAAITVNLNNLNDAPVIASNGGGAMASVSVQENTAAVTTVTSTDPDGGMPAYSIVGGVDAARFTINGGSGVLQFTVAPDFETPTDAGANNVYDVTIQVDDGAGGTDQQTITITIADVAEGLPPFPPSLVPQTPAPPSSEVPGAGSPLPPPAPIVLGTPIPAPRIAAAAASPSNSPSGSVPPPSEAPAAPAQRGDKPLGPSLPLMRELRGYFEEKVAPLIQHAGEEVRKAFDGQALAEGPARISASFRNQLSALEEDLQKATETSESRHRLIVHVTTVGGVTLTAGFITWLLHSGSLLASLASTLPVWRHFDPLPVVLVGDRERHERERDAAVAARHEGKQFHGLGMLLDDEGEHSGQGGKAA